MPAPIQTIDLKTTTRDEMIDITSLIRAAVKQTAVQSGVAWIFCPHTTAALTLQESATPAVKKDMLAQLGRIVPRDAGFTKQEDNSDSHIKASLVGSSEAVIIENGKLMLGTWQAVWFCEFDGPRTRKVLVKVTEG